MLTGPLRRERAGELPRQGEPCWKRQGPGLWSAQLPDVWDSPVISNHQKGCAGLVRYGEMLGVLALHWEAHSGLRAGPHGPLLQGWRSPGGRASAAKAVLLLLLLRNPESDCDD